MAAKILTGREAIEAARADAAVVLYKFADPTEAAGIVTIDEAEEIVREDPSLIWCSVGDRDLAAPEYRVVLDNGGGITLQLPDYAHCYYDADTVATDLLAYIASGNTETWEHGDDPYAEAQAAALDPTYDDIRNGCYRVVTDWHDLDSESSWDNERELREAINRIAD